MKNILTQSFNEEHIQGVPVSISCGIQHSEENFEAMHC